MFLTGSDVLRLDSEMFEHEDKKRSKEKKKHSNSSYVLVLDQWDFTIDRASVGDKIETEQPTKCIAHYNAKINDRFP